MQDDTQRARIRLAVVEGECQALRVFCDDKVLLGTLSIFFLFTF